MKRFVNWDYLHQMAVERLCNDADYVEIGDEQRGIALRGTKVSGKGRDVQRWKKMRETL